MKYLILILSFLSLVFLESCKSKHKPEDNSAKTEKNDSLIVTNTYQPGGGLWKVINAKRVIENGKKNTSSMVKY